MNLYAFILILEIILNLILNLNVAKDTMKG